MACCSSECILTYHSNTVQRNNSISETVRDRTHVHTKVCLEWPILWPPLTLTFLLDTLYRGKSVCAANWCSLPAMCWILCYVYQCLCHSCEDIFTNFVYMLFFQYIVCFRILYVYWVCYSFIYILYNVTPLKMPFGLLIGFIYNLTRS
jgi:hypothetical protein